MPQVPNRKPCMTASSGPSTIAVRITNDGTGKPGFDFGQNTKDSIGRIVGKNWKAHISLSHEKDFAIAFSVIEAEM